MKKILLFIIWLMPFAVNASDCHGSWVNPISDVCWSCLFPLSVGASEVASGSRPDTTNPSSPVCACGHPIPRIGIATGYWEPIALVDITKTPYCMVNLGGMQLSNDNSDNSDNNSGSDDSNSKINAKPSASGEVEATAQANSFYYVHWYKYPLIYWLELATDGACEEKSDFDLAYLAELDPTWRDDELNAILEPEAFIFGNPIAQVACIADSIKTLKWLPIDELFWCAGSQGSMYPQDGWVQEQVSGEQGSLLLAERMTYKLHEDGFLWDTVGQNSPALCLAYPHPIMPKSRYRYQMVNPLPTTGENGCHPFGAATFTWEAMHQYPYKGEDFGYLIWRKRNCCMA